MSADKQNVTLYAGDDCILAYTIVDETGEALPLAGASLVWTLGRQPAGPTIVTKTNANGITITNAAAGQVSVLVSHADTVGLTGTLWHQLVLTDVAGSVSTVATGYIAMKQRI